MKGSKRSALFNGALGIVFVFSVLPRAAAKTVVERCRVCLL